MTLKKALFKIVFIEATSFEILTKITKKMTTLREQKKKEDFAKLAKLATQARKLRDEEASKAKNEIEAMTILEKPLNRYIKKIYNLGNAQIKTFNQWKQEGFKVKKGEKGYLFFSSPKTFKKEVETVRGDKQEIAFNRFCKCFLFAENQVEKIEA